MKIIICGAGQVGGQICRYLAREDSDITIVDSNDDVVRQLAEKLDVAGVSGRATDPRVLSEAGVEDADLIIAATSSDEANIISCMVARSLDSEAKTIVRLRNKSYHDVPRRRRGWPVDIIINPESEVADAAVHLIRSPTVFEWRSILSGKALLLGLRLGQESPVTNTPLRQLSELFPGYSGVVVGLRREGRLGVPTPEDQLFSDDEIYLVVDSGEFARTLQIFNKQHDPCRQLILVGAGNVGFEVAQRLESTRSDTRVKVIERNLSRAESVARELSKTVVLHGEGLDQDKLMEAGIEHANAILTVTDDDKTNLLIATQAKNLARRLRTISLVNEPSLAPLVKPLGVDARIDPRATTVSSILPHIRTHLVNSVLSVGNAEAEVIEAQITDDSQITGRMISNAKLPEGVIVGSVMKGNQTVPLTSYTRFEVGDAVAFFSLAGDVTKTIELLGPDAQLA